MASLENADCVRCHEAEGAQWEVSQHHSAFSEETFQTAHALEPQAFCRGCHAPEADAGEVAMTPAAELGIACVTCHVREDAIVTGLAHDPRPAPHAVVREADFGTESCRSCHQFEFPDSALRDKPELMQSTMDEHAASRFADRSCVDCHSSHRFAGSRDPEMLKSAVEVAAERDGPGTVTVTLRAGHVGHAFPTGDLLRRLEVGATTVGGERTTRRFLARHFGRKRQSSGIALRGELADDRVPANGEPRRVTLRVPDAAGREIRWWVRYQRVAHHRSFDPAGALLDADVELAAGVLGDQR